MTIVTHYEVLVLESDGWVLRRRFPSDEYDEALAEARDIEYSQEKPTKVIREIYDPKGVETGEQVVYLSALLKSGKRRRPAPGGRSGGAGGSGSLAGRPGGRTTDRVRPNARMPKALEAFGGPIKDPPSRPGAQPHPPAASQAPGEGSVEDAIPVVRAGDLMGRVLLVIAAGLVLASLGTALLPALFNLLASFGVPIGMRDYADVLFGVFMFLFLTSILVLGRKLIPLGGVLLESGQRRRKSAALGRTHRRSRDGLGQADDTATDQADSPSNPTPGGEAATGDSGAGGDGGPGGGAMDPASPDFDPVALMDEDKERKARDAADAEKDALRARAQRVLQQAEEATRRIQEEERRKKEEKDKEKAREREKERKLKEEAERRKKADEKARQEAEARKAADQAQAADRTDDTAGAEAAVRGGDPAADGATTTGSAPDPRDPDAVVDAALAAVAAEAEPLPAPSSVPDPGSEGPAVEAAPTADPMPPQVEDAHKIAMNFLGGAVTTLKGRRLSLDAHARFGLNLYLAGAGAALSTHQNLDDASHQALVRDMLAVLGTRPTLAQMFIDKIDEYTLEPRYMHMMQAGREAMGHLLTHDPDPHRPLPRVMDDWMRPQAKAAPSSTIAIVFTDIVGSTDVNARVGDAVARDITRAHNSIVRSALTRFDGREVKHTGDGIMAVFPVVSQAVEAMVAVQRAVAAHNSAHPDRPMALRVGINAGEPEIEENDYYGLAVTLAARICGEAGAGEILCAGVVRDLARGRAVVFRDRGAARLKGIPDPHPICEVIWDEEALALALADQSLADEAKDDAALAAAAAEAAAGPAAAGEGQTAGAGAESALTAGSAVSQNPS